MGLDVIQNNRLDKTGNWDFTSANLTVSDPTTALEIANRQWVLSQVGGGNLWDRSGTSLIPHTTGDDLGLTGTRINKGWFTDLEITNALSGDITGNAGTVTNGVYTTGADTVFLTPATAAATYALALGADDNYVTDAQLVVIGNTSGTNTGDNTVCTSGDATTAETLKTARTIGGVSFNGSANIDLPGVNQSGNQDTSGQADTVTTNADLTGIVTSTGNATAIANKAISTAKLADGTDGELITWNAAGNISHVPVGTATHVLTSNGVGAAPTFQAGGGGGGGLAGTSIRTIGTSGDYSDVAAFIAGESTPYHGVLVSNVTEDSDIPIDGIFVLDLDRYKLTMGANSFTYSAIADVYIKGKGTESGAEIDFTDPTVAFLFSNQAYGASIIDIEGIVIDNNSTSSGYICDSVQHYRNIRYELPNIANCNIMMSDDGSHIIDSQLVGGGTNSTLGLQLTSASLASNIIFSGTWNTMGSLISAGSTKPIIQNIQAHLSTNKARISIKGRATNISTDGAQDIDISISSNEAQITNAWLGGGTFDVSATDKGQFTNIKSTGLLDMTATGATNNLFSNCRFDTALVVAGDRNKFLNCDFIGGISVSSGGNDNGIINCQAGADAGGGANTITVVAGSNRTRIVGCMTDAAISDSGTGTVTSANTIY